MKYCPKCGAKEIDVYVERVLPENNGINMNKARCDCGWEGVACEMVTEPPIAEGKPAEEAQVKEEAKEAPVEPVKATKKKAAPVEEPKGE